MVRIRLRRTGLKNQSTYRIMAADKESPRDGRFLEILGSYNPRTNPSTVEIKEERVYDWMNKGAQPSASVIQIFNSVGLLDRYTRLKAGESQDTLLAEAKLAYEKHAAGGKTEKSVASVEKPAPKKESKKAAEAAPKQESKQVAEPTSKQEVSDVAEFAPKQEINDGSEPAPKQEVSDVAEPAPKLEVGEVAESTPEPETSDGAEATPKPVASEVAETASE
jgi:small subunit ribosomal protein S16